MTHDELKETSFHFESEYIGQGTYRNFYALKDEEENVAVFIRFSGSGSTADDPGEFVEIPMSFFKSVSEKTEQ